MPGDTALLWQLFSERARPCDSVAAFYPLFTHPLATITPHLAVNECLPLRLCRDDLRSVSFCACRSGGALRRSAHAQPCRFLAGALPPVHDWHCGSVDASYIRCALLRFYRGVLPRFTPDIAFLSRRFDLGSRLTLRFYWGVLPRFTPAVCRIAPNRTPCGILRSYSAGRDRHLCVLAVLVRLSSLAGSLRVCALICGDLDGVAGDTGDAGDGTGCVAFVRFCAGTLAL